MLYTSLYPNKPYNKTCKLFFFILFAKVIMLNAEYYVEIHHSKNSSRNSTTILYNKITECKLQIPGSKSLYTSPRKGSDAAHLEKDPVVGLKWDPAQ